MNNQIFFITTTIYCINSLEFHTKMSITSRVYNIPNKRKNQIMRSIDNTYYKKIKTTTVIENNTYIESFININNRVSGCIIDNIIEDALKDNPVDSISTYIKSISASRTKPITAEQIKHYNTYDTTILKDVLEPYILYMKNLDGSCNVKVKNGIADYMGPYDVVEVKCSKYPYSDYAWLQMMLYVKGSKYKPVNYHIVNPLTGTISTLIINNIPNEL